MTLLNLLCKLLSDDVIKSNLINERMVQRFNDQILQNMSPERRARNLSVMKALTQASMKIKNKENEDPLNNNKAPPFICKHSTPLKNQRIADLDSMVPISQAEITASDDAIIPLDSYLGVTKNKEASSEPELVIAKVYDLTSKANGIIPQQAKEKQKVENKSSVIKVVVTKEGEVEKLKSLKKYDADSTPNEALDTIAEIEFFKGLEQSKLFLSTSNLLEEIEADLPSTYSLVRPLNHTFHSLTNYRTATRLARVDKSLIISNNSGNTEYTEVCIPSKRLEYLEMEAMVQKAKAQQAEKALILSKSKKSMAIENLESEKTLLLANLRFDAAVQEIDKLNLLGDVLRKEDFGQITIPGILFFMDDLTKNRKETFICTAREKEQVLASCRLNKSTDGKLCFDEPLKFQNLSKDFVICIELFKRRNKETKIPMKECIMKKLKELASSNFHKSIMNSPSSNHGFVCVACAKLRLEDIARREKGKCRLYFTKPPQHPIKGDSIVVIVKTDFNVKSKVSGFLNVFKNTWHRRWFSQTGYFLNSWLYPEDHEDGKPLIESIYLPACTEKVKPADMELCIRPHSFVITLGSQKQILFSADSNKDMMKWINHLNLIIEHIQLWKPNV